ncbi:hypothetical protein [Streptomyces scopuliridis]|uniref:hypothetical protein n=1 Tax=Streptomyces scopuliridis TaxID=452529 RepID=UPI0036A95A11
MRGDIAPAVRAPVEGGGSLPLAGVEDTGSEPGRVGALPYGVHDPYGEHVEAGRGPLRYADPQLGGYERRP